MKVELLAPAKDKNTAIEAINCGADAIYIGAMNFGARKNACNSIQDIQDVIDYAHKFWVKVFVTMNTILNDSELNEAVKMSIKLSEMGADALIIQDLGLLNRLIELKLPIPIHASTQCDNYLPEKVNFFNRIGLSRVILARELSLSQIKNIHDQNSDLELEAFVHGALCVSMSGQCYLSQAIGGRSANRGECAQPCRKKYTVLTTEGEIIKKDFYALCLKDFNASSCIDDLVKAGISSLKIEGRLKDISYVKNIVSYYRQKLGKGISSGKSFYQYTPDPEKSFNRGFTEYFLKERTDCYSLDSPKSKGKLLGKIIEIKKDCFKLQTSVKITPQDGIYCNGEGFSINKIKDGYIYPNKPVKLNKGDILYRNLDVEFEKELAKPVKRQIALNIKIDNKITIADEDGICLIKELPVGERAKDPEKMKETFIKQLSKTGDSDFYIESLSINSEIPFMPVSQINELRRSLFGDLMQKRIMTYKETIQQKQKPMSYSRYYKDEVDFTANILNKSAKEFYEKCGAKVLEFSFEQKKPDREVALMHCKHCIKYALNMCKSPKKLILEDEYGKKYSLKFDCKNCEMFVISN